MLIKENLVLLVIDVQGKLAEIVYKSRYLLKSTKTMIAGARLFDLPVIWTEQTPDQIGTTHPEISALLSDSEPIVKSSFSCCGEPAFMEALESTGRKQVLVAGIETHVCVYQTVLDLLSDGYEVEILEDAVSSRFKHNKRIALDKLTLAGAKLSSVEMALFELQRGVDQDRFRQLIKLIK